MDPACSISLPTFTLTDIAAERAAANSVANIAALVARQPALASAQLHGSAELSWLFARDGSLTAMLDGTRWWGNCSVPLAAARFMLKSMEVVGTTGCFLNPLHAVQLRVTLDMLHSRQAVVAIVPDDQTLTVLLSCEDFSHDIAAGRLWFASGRQWESELQALFQDNPGLPTPAEFIRPITADSEATNSLIEPAQHVFAQVGESRGDESKRLRERWKPINRSHRRLCLLAPSEFRLWDDAALVLAEMDLLNVGIDVRRLDSDRPTSSSPLALAVAASECDGVFCANIFRSHLPGVIPESMPWITWVTKQWIPAAKDVGPNDRLLLANSSGLAKARQLGWDEARIEIAGRPSLPISSEPGRQPSLVADTHPLAIPKRIEGYSSQTLLWEMIRDELTRDPFLAVDNIDGYLNSRRARFQIGDDGFDAQIFIEQLIVPAVQQGLARRMIKDGMPVRIFGRGWEALDGLADFHDGAVTSRQELGKIVSQSAALIHLWPWTPGHAIETTGRPVIRTKRMHDFLSDVQQALNGTLKPPAQQEPVISPELIARITRGCLQN